jgi:superfamily II DNA/RNA helicase
MKKSECLKQTYDNLFCGLDIPELIENGTLVKDVCYAPKGNKELFKGLETSYATDSGFSTISVNKIFTNPEMIKKVYNEYNSKCKGQKTVVFCASVEHAELVHDYFKQNGVTNSKIYHSKGDENRKGVVKWFKSNRNSILINVDVFTTGFDVKDVENVILARSTRSLALFLQIVGRGGRSFTSEEFTKDHFKLIDLGFNINGVEDVFDGHGMWSDSRDWNIHFNNWSLPKEGQAPSKICPKCDAITHASVKECKSIYYNEKNGLKSVCGYKFPERKVEVQIDDLELISEAPKVNVYQLMITQKKRGFKAQWICYQILDKHVNTLKIHGVTKEKYLLHKEKIDLRIWRDFKKDFDKLRNHFPKNFKKTGFWKEEMQNKINNIYND